MIASEIISRIKIAIGQSSDDDRFPASDLLDIVNEGYIDFCRYTEILEKVSTSVIPALTANVSLPSDFLETRQFRWSYNQPLYPYSTRKLDYNQFEWTTEVASKPENVVYQNYNVIRLKPLVSVAGTITFKYAYIPPVLATSDSPSYLNVFHEALIDFGATECFYQMRDFTNGDIKWNSYLERREKGKTQARQWQRTPDVMMSQRPVSVFNYPYWDNRFRSRK